MPELAVKEKVYITFKEAAEFMGYSRNTLDRRILAAKEGKSTFPYYQEGTKSPYKFKKKELELWRWQRTKGITT